MTSKQFRSFRVPGVLILVLLFLLVPVDVVKAQQGEQEAVQEEEQGEGACAFTLREAQGLYDQGLIEDIPGMLEDCIRDGFTKEERLDAYKLIILSYLFDDDQDQANEEMLKFLKKYPEYQITATDPAEFTYLFNTYDTKHKFTYGGFIGGNMAHGAISELFGVYNTGNGNEPVYRRSSLGLSGGLRINFPIVSHLELSVEGIFNLSSFSLDQGVLYGFALPDVKESHTRIDLPVTFTWDFPAGNFVPFIRAGIQGGYLVSASWTASRLYTGVEQDIADVTGTSLDVTDLRNQFSLWAIGGGGLKYKIPKGYIVLDIRYNTGLTTQNNPEANRYTGTDAAQDQTFLYYAPDSEFSLNNLIFSIGYQRSFYKPKKIIP